MNQKEYLKRLEENWPKEKSRTNKRNGKYHTMKTENCVTYQTPNGKCRIWEPCAIVMMTDSLPLVQIFDGEGNRIDCGQYKTFSEAADALTRAVIKGEKLTTTP